ncbi:Homoserine/homoserine lactone efflux protein [Roseivivax jejudonensis]|uniref:Homoserine/homoserine lactone efflux protein n=1 Tax=Roseivivax jejudonensis TaxID=1529041 RepID=A0A1X7A5X6_9RHOB|nr:LysE family translocator [Roseivivax jejudonensis]SLN71445.1 Homoserine/homoserine lactone efflux protein [Roseivivax jejudonensis]
MPAFDALLTFTVASVVLLAVPGPTIALVIARSLSEGRRVALPLVAGVGLGDLVAASVALAGAGALLSASATAFTVVKLVGAIYLIWVGIRLFRSEPTSPKDLSGDFAGTGAAAFRDGFLVTVFNPKGILFFVAFVPQFVDPAASYLAQAAVFVLLFSSLGVINGAVYAMAASRMRLVLRSKVAMRWVNRAGGTVILGAGVAALFARRSGA